MELRQLKYFLAVADTLNFSRASEVLYISQSALSRQIADLEEELGSLLFIRNKRSVSLTDAGLLLRDEARRIINRTEKLAPMIKNAAELHNGELSLYIGIDSKAMADPDLRKMLTEAVYSLRLEQPGLRAYFCELEFVELQEGLLNGTLDLIFILDNVQRLDERFECHPLWEEEMVLVLRDSRRHGQSDIPQLISQRGVLMLERESRGMAQIMKILDDMGVEASISFAESRNAMTLAMESGESTAILPLSVVNKLNNPELQVFHLNSLSTKMYLISAWKSGRDSFLIEEVLDTLTRLIAGRSYL